MAYVITDDMWATPTLKLSGRRLTVVDAQQIADGLASTDVVRYLDLADNKLGDAGVRIIMEGLRMNRSVEILDLSNNDIQDEGAAALADVLYDSITLGSLMLADNRIRKAGAERLAEALVVNTKLQKLNLQNNRLRGPGALAMAAALRTNKGLKSLNLSKNEVNTAAGVAFAEALRFNSTLQSLNLSYNLLGEALVEWGPTLTMNTTLLELDFEGSLVQGPHVAKFSDKLLRCSLMVLNLSSNDIGDAGLHPLLDALKQQAALRVLDLSKTRITAKSVDEICSMLKFCPPLETLHLDDNKLGCEGVSVLSASLKGNQSLTSINLNRVDMDATAAVALSLALHSNLWCTSLALSGNNITDETCASLCYALKRMTMLNYVDLTANHITNRSKAELAAVFVNNANLMSVPLQGNPMAEELVNGVLTRRVAQRVLEEHPDRSRVIVAPTPVQTRAKDVHLPRVRPSATSILATQLLSGTGGTFAGSGMAAANATRFGMSAGALVPFGTSIVADTQRSTLLPEARAATLLASAEALAMEEAERENGTYPPLIPSKNCLEHPLYPGFGKGRFSNACTVQPMDDPIPYTLYNSLGDRPVQKWTADMSYADTLFNGRPRRVHKINPYSERALDSNIGGLLVTERRLRQAFQELDVDGLGYLDKEEFKQLYTTFDNFGVDATPEEIDDIINKFKTEDDGKLTFEEFSLLMCRVAQR